MAAVDTAQKKRNNYKLLVDPEIKKGQKKVYRLNGKDVPGFPPCGQPKDPRTQKTVLGVAGNSMDYKLPRFKFDKFWEGKAPERDIFVIGLNDSVRGSLFKEACDKIGIVHSIKFHRHPKTKTFLGAATVSFLHSGFGHKAVDELDGKMMGGCYLRAELDDNLEHLKKYLEPLDPVKKGAQDKDKKSTCKQLGKSGEGSISDADEIRTRSSSITESMQDLSESEVEGVHPNTSATNTPFTPTTTTPSKNELFYKFSVLNFAAPPAVSGGTSDSGLSPVFTTPCTPMSIDSGISIKTHSTTSTTSILSPNEAKNRRSLSLMNAALPPLPPEESAPPLPPQDVEAPPPLPPLPPAPGEGDFLENISSDEESSNNVRNKLISPVSLSPPPSPHMPTGSTAVTSHTYDPSLSLQTLLTNRNNTEGGGGGMPKTPPFAPTSPRPAYELEVEEISGDESPVMVYFEPLKVESISDDDDPVATTAGETAGEAGGDDMDISDNENDQDNVIELNVKTAATRVYMGGPGPMMGPHLPPHMPHPHFHPGPFFPPHGHPLPPFPIHPHHPPHFAPHMMLPPEARSPPHPHGRRRNYSRRRYDSPSSSISKDSQVSRPPNGYIGSVSRFRSLTKSKVLKNFPFPKTKTEHVSQDVLFKAMEQLRLILLNDVHKKIVERSAYPVLDSHWEKREKEKLLQISEPEGGDKEESSESQPYRPGIKRDIEPSKERPREREDEEEEEEDEEKPSLPTPRKRLMNFKIPLVRGSQRRDQQQTVVARRRLYNEEQEEVATPPKVRLGRSTRGYYSDISSSEDFSSESEVEDVPSSPEEEESPPSSVSSAEESEDTDYRKIFGSSDSESEFEKFIQSSKQKRKHKKDSTINDFSEEEIEQKTATLRTMGPKSRKRKREIIDESEKLFEQNSVGAENQGPGKDEFMEVINHVPPKPRFKKRLPNTEQAILGRFLEAGLDKEDVQMFRMAMARLKEKGDLLTSDVAWAHYPHLPPSLPPPTKKGRSSRQKTLEEEHVTGCARSEGYYKIDMRDKVKYLPHHRVKNTTTPAETKKKAKSSGRVNRANQRKLASLYSAGDVSSDLAKYNQFKSRKKLLKFAKSTIHNWGLFAMEPIAADEMVIEYVGEVVRQCVADVRERRYEAAGIGSSYLFRVDHDYIIDATRRGGLARFINHCCDPNCYAKVINFSTGKKIVIYSKRDIALGEEITYDYKFPIEDEKIPCLCGAPNCRGTLN